MIKAYDLKDEKNYDIWRVWTSSSIAHNLIGFFEYNSFYIVEEPRNGIPVSSLYNAHTCNALHYM